MHPLSEHPLNKTFVERLKNELQKQKITDSASSGRAATRAVAVALLDCFCRLPRRSVGQKRAAYFSAEFLPGNLTTQSLAALGLEDLCRRTLADVGLSFSLLEQGPDPALGNGGLGRLAACLLDAAAVQDIPLDGYGIRYRYGLFSQKIQNHTQVEEPDLWQKDCPFEKAHPDQTEVIAFGDESVLAVPYDIPIVGPNRINRLRLWDCEPICPVCFNTFANGRFSEAFAPSHRAAAISAFLYPPDDTDAGKELRLKQEYFFSAASIGSLLADFRKTGQPVNALPDFLQIQLNDTHPAVAVLELLRRLCEDDLLDFEAAFQLAFSVFSYTNHTVMAEALECIDDALFARILPRVYPYAVWLNNQLRRSEKKCEKGETFSLQKNGKWQMADLAVYTSHRVNGVAEIHSNLIRETIFSKWNTLYPDRFINITNGISHRRFLCLANPELSHFADARIGPEWRQDLPLLAQLKNFQNAADLTELRKIKQTKKEQLSRFLKEEKSIDVNPSFLFSMQIKRIHEYKRQLLNILAVLGLYLDLKNGRLTNFHPTVFFFSGKAAPGYFLAKEIIRFIGAVSDLLKKDETARRFLQVVFVPDYNVKTAMKLIPAADLSEQLSTAGTEASGTGNMKLSLNGAPTIGTLDGANIEIFRFAGEENNFVFGATKEELDSLYDYDPMNIYYTNERIRLVVDLLKDGTLGNFEGLFASLLWGNGGNTADHYKVLMDYPSYYQARLTANTAYQDQNAFARMSLCNIAAGSHFSADATIAQYQKKVWHL